VVVWNQGRALGFEGKLRYCIAAREVVDHGV
jgi:hypothetical protein